MNQSAVIPMIGAQVWIEPHHTREQIDLWMRILAEHRMPLARIWIFRREVEPNPEQWDFSRCDTVFDSAQAHGVRIVATLTPWEGLPSTEKELAQAEIYIHNTVRRYRNHAALDTWILINEPGWIPKVDALSSERFRYWLETRYRDIEALNAAWHVRHASFAEVTIDVQASGQTWAQPSTFIDWFAFSRFHLTFQLQSWADAVRAEDADHPIHVNPHGLIGNLARMADDLPSWRSFLGSLGASIHPAWHFWALRREQFPLGVAFVCSLIHGASEPAPFWITELQGGNNIYSSVRPLYPTPENIAQWVWTGIGSGAERTIFWLLNSREQGVEAGEWSMLDYQNRPTERLETAGRIAGLIQEHSAFFAGAVSVSAPVTILLSLETMTLQERFHVDDSPVRDRNAHVFEALSLYQCLHELGVSARIKHIHDFQWDDSSIQGHLLILPHVSAMTLEQARNISAFVKKGNTVLATGLTGFYDEYCRVWPLGDFPLAETFGGTFKEVRHLGDKAFLTLTQPKVTLPSCDWIADIDNGSGEVLAADGKRVLAVRNASSKGEAIWVPSPIGLGAWAGDRAPLTSLLSHLSESIRRDLPFRFENPCQNLTLRIMQNGSVFLTVLVNGGDATTTTRLVHPDGLMPSVLWGRPDAMSSRASWTIEAQETLVILWKKIG
jgi:beta-galactosidase